MSITDLHTATPTEIDEALADLSHQKVLRVATGTRLLRQIEKARKQGTTPRPWMEAGLVEADAAITVLDEQIRPLDAEFVRRGRWSRFFLVPGGHIHRATDCSTCNRGRTMTDFRWLPALSGLSDADAVTAHGAILCTVCFPDAPVEWTNGAKAGDDLVCPGTGTADYDEKTARRGYVSGNGGRCDSCGTWQTITRGGVLRKHNRKDGA